MEMYCPRMCKIELIHTRIDNYTAVGRAYVRAFLRPRSSLKINDDLGRHESVTNVHTHLCMLYILIIIKIYKNSANRDASI